MHLRHQVILFVCSIVTIYGLTHSIKRNEKEDALTHPQVKKIPEEIGFAHIQNDATAIKLQKTRTVRQVEVVEKNCTNFISNGVNKICLESIPFKVKILDEDEQFTTDKKFVGMPSDLIDEELPYELLPPNFESALPSAVSITPHDEINLQFAFSDPCETCNENTEEFF